MNITILPSRFYSSRNGTPVRYIVLHTTEGTDSRTWLTETGNVSANYLIQGTTAYRLVPEQYAAWHAGRIVGDPTTPLYTGMQYPDSTWSVNPNDESIGVEMEGFARYTLDTGTLQTCVDLIRDIRTRFPGLPLVSHSELSPGDRSDPGLENRSAIENLLAEEADMTPAQEAMLRRVLTLLEARESLVWTARAQRQLDVERGTPYDPTKPPLDQRIKQP